MSIRQSRMRRAARRSLLGAIATTTACCAWLLASGMASTITN